MQRQQHIDAELLTDADVRFEQPLEKNTYVLSEDETPCTRVNYISLDDKTERKFSFLPSMLMKETAFKTGMCLGSNNLSKLQKAAQQILIVRGYLTSQAIIQPQNMDSGILKPKLILKEKSSLYLSLPSLRILRKEIVQPLQAQRSLIWHQTSMMHSIKN